jgi:hypothetical protein
MNPLHHLQNLSRTNPSLLFTIDQKLAKKSMLSFQIDFLISDLEETLGKLDLVFLSSHFLHIPYGLLDYLGNGLDRLAPFLA